MGHGLREVCGAKSPQGESTLGTEGDALPAEAGESRPPQMRCQLVIVIASVRCVVVLEPG